MSMSTTTEHSDHIVEAHHRSCPSVELEMTVAGVGSRPVAEMNCTVDRLGSAAGQTNVNCS